MVQAGAEIFTYNLALQYVAGYDAALGPLVNQVSVLRSQMRPARLAAQLWPIMAGAIASADRDDRITADAEARLNQLITVLGLTWNDARQQIPQAWEAMFVGRANDGRMPILDPSHCADHALAG